VRADFRRLINFVFAFAAGNHCEKPSKPPSNSPIGNSD
jgi:hypothetical protein